MKEFYKKMFNQIHAPKELNEYVLSEVKNSSALSQKRKVPCKQNWLKPAICMICILGLLAGGLLYTYPNVSIPNSNITGPDIPFGGLVITASDAEMPSSNNNGGLGIAVDSTSEERCMFQISGIGIQSLSLHITNGVLFREGSTEAQTFIEDAYTDSLKYGIQLTDQSGTLTVTANNNETFSYALTMETLRLSRSADGQTTLVPLLSGDPSKNIKGIYAVDRSKCQWMGWPINGAYIIDLSMPYGYSPNGTFHSGIDIPAESGTPISAAADGKIIESGTSPEYGNYVILNHGNGLVTQYNHCKSIHVDVGDSVQKGDVIASVGKTGMATGSFLHFEIRQDGVPQDPTAYFEADMRAQLSMEYV